MGQCNSDRKAGLHMHEQTKMYRLVTGMIGEKTPESSISRKGGKNLEASTFINVRVECFCAYFLDKGFVAKSYMF